MRGRSVAGARVVQESRVRGQLGRTVGYWEYRKARRLASAESRCRGGSAHMLEKPMGPNRLWLAAYCEDVFGSLPSARVRGRDGHETRGCTRRARSDGSLQSSSRKLACGRDEFGLDSGSGKRLQGADRVEERHCCLSPPHAIITPGERLRVAVDYFHFTFTHGARQIDLSHATKQATPAN